jgi:Ca2+-binding RTX toxin-like protein
MVYDVTSPLAPKFVQYINNRDFTQSTSTDGAKDLGVEDLKFIPADESPTGTPLVMSANEISGTVTLFAVRLPTGARVTAQGVLEIVGTPGSDRVHLSTHKDQIRIQADFLAPAIQFIPLAGINSIHVLLGAGDDRATVDKNLTLPLVLEGWTGDDLLMAGGGASTVLGGLGDDVLMAHFAAAVLVGGNGDDSLHGGKSRNVLIGGDGRDALFGGSDQDLLIGGATRYDIDPVALAALRDFWSGPGPFAARKTALQSGIDSPHGKVVINDETVQDDEDQDRLFGGGGLDWLFT